MSPFAILAESNRRNLLDQLVAGAASVNELVASSTLTQPAVSKHLKILREAGFVTVTKAGQKRLYAISPEPFQELDRWLMPYREFWAERLDALEAHLADEATSESQRNLKRKTENE